MNLDEAVELLKVVSAITMKEPAKRPEIRIFHEIGEGYTLNIKKNQSTESTVNILIESLNLVNLKSENRIAT
jgi:hypothetical protein